MNKEKRLKSKARKAKTKVSHKGATKQIMCQSPPPVARMKSENERNRKLEKTISLEGPSPPPTMACLALYKAGDHF